MKENAVKRVEGDLIKFVKEVGRGLGRSERIHWCGMYMKGLLMEGERKSIQPIAQRLEGGNEQALQQFINQSPWDAQRVGINLCEHLIKKLKADKPKLNVLLSSGYMDDKSDREVIYKSGYKYIQKPYGVRDLLKTIKTVISS